MGRKKGQQQRTKGNVLPSSSVRSADLLAREDVTSGLGLHSASLTGLGNVPELAGLDSIANIEFRTALKKLYKRDVTTKLKALTEFLELCNSCEQHEVLTVLPYWPRIYNRLFEDNDRRVRENSQKAMSALVAASGKNLALQLKNIMGCWFVSQCDSYAPSALAAEAAIGQAFAGDKKIEAFVFCRNEILKCITHYLFGPQARKERGSDQEGNNYHRMMASCLDGFSLYIRNVVKCKPVDDEIQNILAENRFWKLQKHSSPSVRGGFYSVIEALCIVTPDLVTAHLGDACKSVFHRLDESNVAVSKHLYAAAVALVSKCDSWHEVVDLQKGVIPGLCSILKSGCHGLGAYVLPSLLPILAKIPSSVDLFTMFSKILEAMRICLNHDQVKPSKHGSELAVSAFFEILLLSANRIVGELNDPEVEEKLIHLLLNDNVLYLFEESIVGRCNKSSVGRIYTQMPLVIHSWDAKITGSSSASFYSNICHRFWAAVDILICKYALNLNDMAPTKLIVQFLDEMLHYNGQTIVRRHSVKFVESTPASSLPEQPHTSLTGSEQVIRSVNRIIADKLLPFPWKVCEETILLYKDIVERLGNRKLFIEISDQRGIAEDVNRTDKVAMFIQDVLLGEIQRIISLQSDLKMRFLESLSDIICHSLRHCQPSESFPFEITHLIETDVSKPFFAVTLHTVFSLERYASSDPMFATWLYDMFLDIENPLWGFLQSVANCLSECQCPTSERAAFVNAEKGWHLLEAVMTKSVMLNNGERKFLCNQSGFIAVSSKLLSNIESFTCESCYNVVLSKTARVLLSCLETGRNYDTTLLNKDNQSIWLELMTRLLRTHCFDVDGRINLLPCFSEFFSLAASGLVPFTGSDSVDIVEYIGSQSAWIKGKLLSLDSDVYSKVTDNIKVFIDTVLEDMEISSLIGNILIGNLVPSATELETARGMYGDSISLGEMTILEDSQLSHVASSRYLKLLHFFREIIIHVTNIPVFDTSEGVSWKHESFLTFGKELAIAATLISDVELLNGLTEALGSNYDSNLRSVILEMSMEQGKMWPHCVRLLGSKYNQDEWDVVFKKFEFCVESSDITLNVFETMLVALKFASADKFSLPDMISRLFEVDPEKISASDVHLFSLIVSALSSSLESDKDLIRKTLDIATKWRSENDDLFAFDEQSLRESELHILCLNSSTAQLFSYSVKRLAESLSESQWDFILCALLSWVESISKSFEEIAGKVPVIALLRSSCVLLEEVNAFMISPVAKEDPTVPSNLLHEWSEFFSMQINTSIVAIFISSYFSTLPISESVCVMKCLRHTSSKSVVAAGSELKPKLTPDSTLPPEVQTVMNCLYPLLQTSTGSRIRQGLIIGSAYTLLNSMFENLTDSDLSSPPEPIFNLLKRLSSDVESLFDTPDAEVSKSASPESDDYNTDESEEENDGVDTGEFFKIRIVENAPRVLGYFLTWKLLINLANFVSAEKKSLYVESLMKGSTVNVTEDLLPKVFKIMIGKRSLFESEPDLMFEGDINLEDLEHVVGSLYRDFLIQMPAASRIWFNDLTKAVRSRVDTFTSLHVSPVLIEKEFKAIQVTKQQQAVEGMEIIARTGAREVHATYKLNEIQMEIAVCLSANHPLGPINVKTEKRAGVVMGQWRYWLLQITMFLQYQNGGIIDGLLLWKDKVDKRFEGVEECMICFSVVHGSSQSLPKLKCKTCKKKYHAECLYKWFDTSNNSTCPLCRSPMIFR